MQPTGLDHDHYDRDRDLRHLDLAGERKHKTRRRRIAVCFIGTQPHRSRESRPRGDDLGGCHRRSMPLQHLGELDAIGATHFRERRQHKHNHGRPAGTLQRPGPVVARRRRRRRLGNSALGHRLLGAFGDCDRRRQQKRRAGIELRIGHAQVRRLRRPGGLRPKKPVPATVCKAGAVVLRKLRERQIAGPCKPL